MTFVLLSNCLSHALIISLRVFFSYVLCLVISEVVFTDVRQYFRTVSCIISCTKLRLFFQSVISGCMVHESVTGGAVISGHRRIGVLRSELKGNGLFVVSV